MSTAAWTIADLAELTSTAAQLAITETEQYCEHCGIVPAVERYCEGCTTDIINYLLWEEHSKLEQLELCLHMAVIDEDTMIGKALY